MRQDLWVFWERMFSFAILMVDEALKTKKNELIHVSLRCLEQAVCCKMRCNSGSEFPALSCGCDVKWRCMRVLDGASRKKIKMNVAKRWLVCRLLHTYLIILLISFLASFVLTMLAISKVWIWSEVWSQCALPCRLRCWLQYPRRSSWRR